MNTTSLLAQESGSGGSSLSFFVILIAIPLVMYFLMIRPQRKRMRQQAEMQAAIGIGDEVVTNSGIYGFITGVEDDKFWLEIDDDVQIRIARAAIQGRVGTPEAEEAPAGDKVDAPEVTKRDKSSKRGSDKNESSGDRRSDRK